MTVPTVDVSVCSRAAEASTLMVSDDLADFQNEVDAGGLLHLQGDAFHA